MPKLKKSTIKAKAQNRTKAYIKAGLNQSELARRTGKHRSTINSQINSQPVQDVLQDFLDNPKLSRRLIRVAGDGLKAKKSKGGLSRKMITDHDVRYKFWNGLMTAKGKIKPNGTVDNSKHLHLTVKKKEQIFANARDAFKDGFFGQV